MAYLGNDPVNMVDPDGENYEAGHQRLADAARENPGALAAVGGTALVIGAAIIAAPEIGVFVFGNAPSLTEATAIGGELVMGDAAGPGLFAGSAVAANMLGKELASASQMSQIAKGGGKVLSQPAKQAERIAAQTGAEASNIQKVSSDACVAKDGQQIQTHAFRDASTNEVIEPKVIIDEQQ